MTTQTVSDLIGSDTKWRYFKRAGTWQSRTAGWTTEPVAGEYLAFTYQFRGRKVLDSSSHVTADDAKAAAWTSAQALQVQPEPDPTKPQFSWSNASDYRAEFSNASRMLLVKSTRSPAVFHLCLVWKWEDFYRSDRCCHWEDPVADITNFDVVKVVPSPYNHCEECAEYHFVDDESGEEKLCEHCEVWGGDFWVGNVYRISFAEWEYALSTGEFSEIRDRLDSYDQVLFSARTMREVQVLVENAAREYEDASTS